MFGGEFDMSTLPQALVEKCKSKLISAKAEILNRVRESRTDLYNSSLLTPTKRYPWVLEMGSVGARLWANVKDVATRRTFRPAMGLIPPSQDPFLERFRQLRGGPPGPPAPDAG